MVCFAAAAGAAGGVTGGVVRMAVTARASTDYPDDLDANAAPAAAGSDTGAAFFSTASA